MRGEIWLAGIDQPLVLELTGDCAPDAAGCQLSFEVLTKTIATADAVSEKRFLPAERFSYYRNELFAIREEILELMTQLRSR